MRLPNKEGWLKRWYPYRLARVWFRNNPLKGMLIVALIAFGLGAGVYAFLDQYDWGKILLNLIFTMLVFEASAASMVAHHKPLWQILIFLTIADVGNVLIDLFVVNRLLAWRHTRYWIDWVNRRLKLLARRIKSLWPWKKKKTGSNGNGFMEQLNSWRNHVQDIKKNPSKAGLLTVFVLAAVPRLPFMILGGVSLGIFILRYNQFSWRGWAALIIGIILRTSFWLGSLYGLISIF